MTDPDLSNRRPVKFRARRWAQALAALLARQGVSPDVISALSVAFAVMGCAALALSGISFGFGRGALLLLAVFSIQMRLLCNVLDGLVAVEHGKGGPLGAVWNELPDRLSDALFLIGAGYAASDPAQHLGPALGWLCAVLAVLTAYVRELGRALDKPADFAGPLAKPQRMGLLTVMALVSLFEGAWGWHGETMLGGLGLMAALTALTVWNRTARLAAELNA
ncbi:CDP-alcohol phosphatidyltransferase family protein [Caulobacter sp. 17J65-9]|uniref:CDP-alcohol phosphatidyltransferase family protein n=1 Tax=Caulobacter sp. 17J65-9 TaxID=2709382 RepID=UPI0013CA1514|nr:CDP-alcohol phosphatidyltransferase family protein [Caulobacter sp. 17J65-9]NEX93602.1 CDP-alcohol phosphatidyltransferase family protein [Caulobacter sp. 17J65-9]